VSSADSPTRSATSESGDWRSAFGPGITAIRQQWGPLVAIQGLVLALTLSYFMVPGFRLSIDYWAQVKAQQGVWLSFVAGFVASSILPELVKTATSSGAGWTALRGQRALALGITCGFSSMLVDWQYQFLSRLLGTGRDVGTIAAKIVLDQFVISCIVTVPFIVLFSVFLEHQFRPGHGVKSWRAWLGPQPYRQHVFPVQLMGWAVWIPALIGIFSLPLPVQFPVAILITAAWSLIISFLTGRTQVNRSGDSLRP